jgi:hypothetical protein
VQHPGKQETGNKRMETVKSQPAHHGQESITFMRQTQQILIRLHEKVRRKRENPCNPALDAMQEATTQRGRFTAGLGWSLLR